MVAVAAVFTLARFSEAFLILRALSVDLPIFLAPAVMVVMNVFYSLAAYPAGILSDRTNRVTVLAVGLIFLVAADLVLGLVGNIFGIAVGVILWGLHMGFTQGLLATFVADTAPADLRGTAFGMFNLVSGSVLLAASVIAGVRHRTRFVFSQSTARPLMAGRHRSGWLAAPRWGMGEHVITAHRDA